MITDTRLIPLTQGKFATVDAVDYDFLMQWKWHAWHDPKTRKSLWYALRSRWTAPPPAQMHHVVAARMGLPKSPMYDHADGDGLNNARQNIRPATKRQNAANSIKSQSCTSRLKGVSWDKVNRRWQAYIRRDGRVVRLGRFDSEQEAHAAYVQAAKVAFGEFARF